MRIAWTGPVADTGGVPGMGLLMLRELLRQGVEVDVYLPKYAFEDSPIEPTPGLRLIEQRSGWSWGRWYSRTPIRALFSGLVDRTRNNVLLSVRLLREHRRRPYDAVYQLSTTELFLLGRVGRRAPPIVVHPCTHAAGELRWHRAEQDYALEVENPLIHALARALLTLRARLQPTELTKADLVLGLSDRFNEHIHEDYGVPWDKLRTVRTPVDLQRFTPAESGTPLTPRTILFISRISVRKGVPEIVELSHRLSDLAGSVRLLVIGGTTQWSNYAGHLRGLDSRTAEYRGVVPTDELPAMLRSASMLLVPSPYEPGSIVTAEALACGLPVVLSDEIGNGEVVAGPHARFHRPGDVDGIEHAVRSLLDAMSTDEVALRGSARRNAEEMFAPDVVVSQLVEILSGFAPADGLSARRSFAGPRSAYGTNGDGRGLRAVGADAT